MKVGITKVLCLLALDFPLGADLRKLISIEKHDPGVTFHELARETKG